MKELALDDRPREKLARHGAGALGDNELVAIVLASYRVTPLRGEDEGYKFAGNAFDRLIEANRP